MTIRITSSEAAVAATPYVLGFTPTDSMVLMFSDPGFMSASLRVDLPDAPDLGWLRMILSSVPDPAPESVILIVYADTVPEQYAQRLIDWLMEVFTPVLEILDLVVVYDGVATSLVKAMREGAQGVPVAQLANHPVVAECIAEGMSKVHTRQDLESRLDYVDDAFAREVVALLQTPPPNGLTYEQWREQLERDGLRVLLGTDALRPVDVVTVGLACCDVFARDPLIALLIDAHEQDDEVLHMVRDRLGFAVSRLPEDVAGPAAATLALLCWVGGGGAAAMIAAQKAMDTDPTNTLGPLVANALQHGLPPHTWGSITQDIPMEVLRGQYRRSA